MTYKILTDEAEDDGSETALGIFNRILQSHDEMAPLRELIEDGDRKLALLMKSGDLKLRGQAVAGLAALPDAQGAMKPLFAWMLEEMLGYSPDWLIILSADWWEDAKDIDREALVFHECMHCGQLKDKYGDDRFNAMGEPMVGILPHDTEEFHSVVRRYGAWTPDLVEMREAMTSHDKSRVISRDGLMSSSGLKVISGGRK